MHLSSQLRSGRHTFKFSLSTTHRSKGFGGGLEMEKGHPSVKLYLKGIMLVGSTLRINAKCECFLGFLPRWERRIFDLVGTFSTGFLRLFSKNGWTNFRSTGTTIDFRSNQRRFFLPAGLRNTSFSHQKQPARQRATAQFVSAWRR